MKPVSNWKDAPRWLSVQIAAVLVVLPQAWALLPPDVKAFLPPAWEPFILSGLALAVIVGRLKDQSK